MVIAGDHEYMSRSPRINVAEGDRARITRHYGRRYLGGGNAAEQALRHAEDLNVFRAGNAADIYMVALLRTHGAPPLWCSGLASFWLSVAQG